MNSNQPTSDDGNTCSYDAKMISILKSIRLSFPDAATVYQYGACYGLYTILSRIFEGVDAYETPNGNHIVCKYKDHYYDIKGPVIGKKVNTLKKLSANSHIEWQSCVDGQRFEDMLQKKEN